MQITENSFKAIHKMTDKKHVPLPKETKAFICANCGAVALDANKICKVQGTGKKVDWCGTETKKTAGIMPQQGSQ